MTDHKCKDSHSLDYSLRYNVETIGNGSIRISCEVSEGLIRNYDDLASRSKQ